MFRVFPLGRSGTKPGRGRGLDGANPLTRGLVIALPYYEGAGVPYNLVNGVACVTAPGGQGADFTPLTWRGGQAGLARYSAPGTAGTLSTAYDKITSPSFSTAAFSVEMWFAFTVFPAATGNAAIFGDGTKNLAVNLISPSVGNLYPSVFVDQTNFSGSSTGARTYTLGATNHLVVTYNGSIVTAYLDGVEIASGSIAVGTAVNLTTTYSLTNNAGAGASNAMLGNQYQLNVWSRPLSANDVAERYADPWGIYEPSPIARFWMAPSGATLVSAADSSTLTDSASLSATIATLDSATLADSAGLAAFLAALESASLLDSASVAATLAAVDSADLTDISALDLLFAVLDAAGLAEAQVLSVLAVAADSATLDEFALVSELIFAADDAFMLDLASLNMNIPSRVTGYAAPIGGVPDPRFSRLRYL